MYDKTVLENGLRVITYSMPRMESVSVGVWLRVGSRYESRNTSGIAHFLEHLVFKGSRRYSCQQIKELIEGVGGALNGFTSEEATCYFAKLPAAKQFRALDILADMAVNPLLKQSDIEREKFVVLEEIKMHKDLPQSHVHDLFQELLWPRHPLGAPILGENKTILRFNRQDLISFQKKHYTPSDMVIAACGRLEHKEILKRIKEKLGSLKNDSKNAFEPVPSYEQGAKIRILKKDIAQTHLALGFYGINRDHPDKYIYSLLHVVLGANMSSRLFSEVREKRGLAYAIGSYIKGFADSGMFLIHAGVDNAKLVQAVEVIARELRKIKKKLVSSNELRRAKDFYIGQLRLALESTLEHMFWIGEPTLHLNKTYSFAEVLKKIEKISPHDIRRLAQEIFKAERARLAIIGPLKEKQGEKKLYGCVRNL
jgi:predicted Zn-dependent peptidase